MHKKPHIFSQRRAVLGVLAIYASVIITGCGLFGTKNSVMPASSMMPTIQRGDKITINFRAYKNSMPRRGDIVAYKPNDYPNRLFVSRIVGLGGEKLQIKGGRIYINGVSLQFPPAIVEIEYTNVGLWWEEEIAVEIPKDSYFLLGDNSSGSKDSRYSGPVYKEKIIGKVTHIIKG